MKVPIFYLLASYALAFFFLQACAPTDPPLPHAGQARIDAEKLMRPHYENSERADSNQLQAKKIVDYYYTPYLLDTIPGILHVHFVNDSVKFLTWIYGDTNSSSALYALTNDRETPPHALSYAIQPKKPLSVLAFRALEKEVLSYVGKKPSEYDTDESIQTVTWGGDRKGFIQYSEGRVIIMDELPWKDERKTKHDAR
jgi:hypothetical protein